MRNRLRIGLAASWIAVGLLLGPAAFASPSADTMSYFYSVYSKVLGLTSDSQEVPDRAAVDSAFSGMDEQVYGLKPIAGYDRRIYAAALDEFDKELQTYDQVDAKAQSIDAMNQAAASAWLTKLGSMAVAACKQLAAAGVGQDSWTMGFSCLNPGIPSSAANIVVLADSYWPGKYRLPPGPHLVPNPYSPQYPSFAFILANYMTYFHLHPGDLPLLDQTTPLYSPLVAALPRAFPGVEEAHLRGTAQSFQIPFVVSEDDLAVYQSEQDAAWRAAHRQDDFPFNTTDATAQLRPPTFIPRVIGLPPGGGTSGGGSPSGVNDGGPPPGTQLPS